MKKVLICYFSRTGKTQQMAEYIAEGVRISGHEAELKKISDVKNEKELMGYHGYAFGAPTYHRAMPGIADPNPFRNVLCHLLSFTCPAKITDQDLLHAINLFLFGFLKHLSLGSAHRTGSRRLLFSGKSTYRADIIRIIFLRFS